MAADTQDPSTSSSSSSSQSPTSPTSPPSKTYETFTSSSPASSSTPTRPPNANALPPSYSLNTAGAPSHTETPTLTNALKTLRFGDFAQVPMYPCVRESLLTGIGGGFFMGGIRSLLGAPIPKSANWAVGTFVFASLGAYELCGYRRRVERTHMKRAVELMEKKKEKIEGERRRRRGGRGRAEEMQGAIEAEHPSMGETRGMEKNDILGMERGGKTSGVAILPEVELEAREGLKKQDGKGQDGNGNGNGRRWWKIW